MSLLTNYLNQGAKAIAACAINLDDSQVLKALEILNECHRSNRKVVITGVGKSGIVARKIAATFSSLSLTSIYLNPLDALHGDLGIIAEKDTVILLSNSGETIEILEILPHLKNRRTNLISIVGNTKSTLARNSDSVLNASVDKEICPLNLAPTASTSVAMAIGDALAASWMQMAGISHNDFAVNHPSGTIGKRLILKTEDLMIPIEEIGSVSCDDKLSIVINKLTVGSKTRGAIGATWIKNIKEPKKLDALITDGDLRRVLQKYSEDSWSTIIANDFATFKPICITSDAPAIDALKLMESNPEKKVYILPVIKNEEIVGMVRMHDLISSGI